MSNLDLTSPYSHTIKDAPNNMDGIPNFPVLCDGRRRGAIAKQTPQSQRGVRAMPRAKGMPHATLLSTVLLILTLAHNRRSVMDVLQFVDHVENEAWIPAVANGIMQHQLDTTSHLFNLSMSKTWNADYEIWSNP